MKTLDRNRRFAETYGVHKAKYYQDGYWFDIDGNEIPEMSPKEEPKKQQKTETKAVSEIPTVKKETSSSIPSIHSDRVREKPVIIDQQKSGQIDSSGVDLDKWAVGDEQHQWFKIKAALIARYGENAPSTKQAAIEKILSEKS